MLLGIFGSSPKHHFFSEYAVCTTRGILAIVSFVNFGIGRRIYRYRSFWLERAADHRKISISTLKEGRKTLPGNGRSALAGRMRLAGEDASYSCITGAEGGGCLTGRSWRKWRLELDQLAGGRLPRSTDPDPPMFPEPCVEGKSYLVPSALSRSADDSLMHRTNDNLCQCLSKDGLDATLCTFEASSANWPGQLTPTCRWLN